MKKVIYLLLGITLISYSCKKDEPATPENSTPTTTLDPCNGDDGFCMTYGSTQKSGPASLFVYNQNKVRVFWEKGSGNSFEQVELDINGLTPGTYNVDNLAIPGSSAFIQYYSAANGVNNPAYGTVIVTELDTNGVVTGTFTATMNDSTKIIDGKFTNIRK